MVLITLDKLAYKYQIEHCSCIANSPVRYNAFIQWAYTSYAKPTQWLAVAGIPLAFRPQQALEVERVTTPNRRSTRPKQVCRCVVKITVRVVDSWVLLVSRCTLSTRSFLSRTARGRGCSDPITLNLFSQTNNDNLIFGGDVGPLAESVNEGRKLMRSFCRSPLGFQKNYGTYVP